MSPAPGWTVSGTGDALVPGAVLASAGGVTAALRQALRRLLRAAASKVDTRLAG